MNNLKKALVIAGPTGVGKTKISLNLAKKIDAEIISADSAQVYKKLDIGTAKIKQNEMQNIKHHMLDMIEPTKKYSVGDFEKAANKILNRSSNKNFLIVGGTGLYINSITNGLSKLPQANSEIRKYLSTLSNSGLYEMLQKNDNEAAKNIHINNRIRLERALEVFLISGEKFSVLSKKNIKNNSYTFFKIALERNREQLYENINKRVDLMFQEGLIEEVKNLYEQYGEKILKLNIIGYTEIINYFNNIYSLEKAKYEIKKNSRHYAKRQFTWFKADKDYIWYNLDEISEENIIDQILNKFFIVS